ncbi:BNI3L protein, partial [Centropus unirufus]|nr:BNI3L protein [Centropus unirufus]
ARLLLGSPAWDSGGAGPGAEQPGHRELLPPRQVRELGTRAEPCPQLPRARCQRDVPGAAKRSQQRPPASLAWACAPRPWHLDPKQLAAVCSPQPVPWSLQGGVVGRKKRLFSSELLLLFIPSLLLSHLLTLGLGIYIGKRLAASSANPL